MSRMSEGTRERATVVALERGSVCVHMSVIK